MNALNRFFTALFDAALSPLEKLGIPVALIVVSGIFGVLALLVFKHISWQAGIKGAKDKIKGHMIAIRIYQDDMAVVGRSVGGVLWHNLKYVSLNFGPFIPLAIPFLFVAAQLVVRYAYDPLPTVAESARLLPGQGTMVEVELAPEHRAEVAGLKLELPAGLRALSPLVRAPSEGRAFVEIAASEPGEHVLTFQLADGTRATKQVVCGAQRARTMQPRRVSARDWYRMNDPDRLPALWPAEPAFEAASPFRTIALSYPTRDLGWLPGGEMGILATFVLASMVVGLLALKPLGVQI